MVKGSPRLAARRHSVALVGMDGSGKSTQADRLCRTLRAQHKQALLIHPFGRKALAFLPLRPKPGGSSAGAAGRGQPGRARSRLRQVAAIIELLDIGVYIWAAHIRSLGLALGAAGEVWLVSDRSFDDLLVKHRRLQTLSPAVLATARRLVPVPERTIWLHTDPGVALQRDGEFAPTYYQELHAGYTFAAQRYGWDVIHTSHQSPEAVAVAIERLLGLGGSQAPAGGPGSFVRSTQLSEAQSPEAQPVDLGES